MTPGRKPLNKKEIRFFVPEELYNRIYLILLDPFTGRPAYGKMSKVGEKLLRGWIVQVEKEGLDV